MTNEELAELEKLLLRAEVALQRYSHFIGAEARRDIARGLFLAARTVGALRGKR